MQHSSMLMAWKSTAQLREVQVSTISQVLVLDHKDALLQSQLLRPQQHLLLPLIMLKTFSYLHHLLEDHLNSSVLIQKDMNQKPVISHIGEELGLLDITFSIIVMDSMTRLKYMISQVLSLEALTMVKPFSLITKV